MQSLGLALAGAVQVWVRTSQRTGSICGSSSIQHVMFLLGEENSTVPVRRLMAGEAGPVVDGSADVGAVTVDDGAVDADRDDEAAC